MRYLLAICVYLAGLCVIFLTGASEHDSLAIPVALVTGVGAGMIVRRWWFVLAALLVVPVVAAQPCHPSGVVECDTNMVALALYVFVPIEGALLSLGVGAGQLFSRLVSPAN